MATRAWWCAVALAACLAARSAESEASEPGATVDWALGMLVATGSAPPQPRLPAAMQLAVQRRVALADALRRLGEAARGVRVTSETTVVQHERVSRVVQTALDTVLRNQQVLAEGYTGPTHDLYQVTLALPLGRRPGLGAGLAAAVLPQLPATEAAARTPGAVAPVVLAPVDPAVPPTRDAGPFSGLVVDARGCLLEPCLRPALCRPDGVPLVDVTRVVAGDEAQGAIATYVGSLEQALSPSLAPRVGAHPLVVRARGRQGSAPCNAVLSAEDAAAVLAEDARAPFLAACRVVFVCGPPPGASAPSGPPSLGPAVAAAGTLEPSAPAAPGTTAEPTPSSPGLPAPPNVAPAAPLPVRAWPSGWSGVLARWSESLPAAPRYRLVPKDDMPQVLIPAGTFTMGSPTGVGDESESPPREVALGDYWMDAHPVTQGQYKRFCEETGWRLPLQLRDSLADDQPVVFVQHGEALMYAQWAGRALPTEAEWERAARGGVEGRLYPWGDTADDRLAARAGRLEPVCHHAPNGFGLFDMAGNAAQWCLDFYDPRAYAWLSARNPLCLTGNGKREHVVRGGHYASRPAELRVAARARLAEGAANGTTGFRCVSRVE